MKISQVKMFRILKILSDTRSNLNVIIRKSLLGIFCENLSLLWKIVKSCISYFRLKVTWRREDGNDIILKDNTGTKQQGIFHATSFTSEHHLHTLPIVIFPTVASFSGEVLKLTKLSRGEMGSYLCIASNGMWTQTLEYRQSQCFLKLEVTR